ncbi:MAG: hypothetical protein C0404_08935 [Verrucomicrobia bacterium]|nr:hypothetical protein [Verrucomicrobiota bacterium]
MCDSIKRLQMVVCGCLLAAVAAAADGSKAADETAAEANDIKGRQEREEVFAFAKKPSVRSVGSDVSVRYEITFETTGKCDATVAILDKDGKIVRHLASGVLGKNAPWPFKQDSLAQSLEWDGKDDRGQPVPAGCKVKVGLGLKASLDKLIGDEPRLNAGGSIMACDGQGNLYSISDNRSSRIGVLDREGRYVRTVWPPPASMPAASLGTIDFTKRVDGKMIPFTVNGYAGSFFKSQGINVFRELSRQTPVITPDGKELLFTMGGRELGRYLVRLGTDGSLSAGNIMTIDVERYADRPESKEMNLAVSPDGVWVYFSGGFEIKKKNCAVYRRKLAELKAPAGKGAGLVRPEVFVGEPGVPGADETHLNQTRGVACDKDGNVHVADLGNNRIQVFSPEGKFLRSLAVQRPDQIAVHPKTGAVYVLRDELTKAASEALRCYELVKLDRDGKPVAALPLKTTYYGSAHRIGSFCLDAASEEPVLWARTGEGLLKLVDRGDKIEKVKSLTGEISAPWKNWAFPDPGSKGYIVADRSREEIYVKDPGSCFPTGTMRIDGRTGKLLAHLNTNSEELHIGPDGLVYVRAEEFGRYIVRFNPADGKCVPFAKGVEYTWCGQKTTAIPVFGAAKTGGCRTFQDGFSVASNGDIYLILVEPDGKVLEDLAKLGQGLKLKGTPGQPFTGALLLQVYAPDGSLKHASALPGLIQSNGLRVDRSGRVYVSLAARKVGVKEPEGIAPGARFDHHWGTLLKFDSAFNKFPIGRIHGTWDTPAMAGGATFTRDDNREKPAPEKLLWHYAGLSPSCSLVGYCVCYNSRFDLDGFDRAWVPMSQNFSVDALDANGNVILRVGTYGNPDSRGKDSPVLDPKTGQLRQKQADDPADLKPPRELADEIGLRSPRFVAASDEALYINDTGNQRFVRCALSYAAEETTVVP